MDISEILRGGHTVVELSRLTHLVVVEGEPVLLLTISRCLGSALRRAELYLGTRLVRATWYQVSHGSGTTLRGEVWGVVVRRQSAG